MTHSTAHDSAAHGFLLVFPPNRSAVVGSHKQPFAANRRLMLHCLKIFTECVSQRLNTNTVTTRTQGTCPRGPPCGVPYVDSLIRTRFKAVPISSAYRSTTDREDPGTADIPRAGRDLEPSGSNISPFSQDCGTRVSRQYLPMAAERTP